MMNSLISPGVKKSNLKKIKPYNTKGSSPLSRIKSSTAVTDDGEFFLFGGFDEDDNLDGAVYILDVINNEWKTHPSDQIYREGHTSLYIGYDTILLYGGVPEESYNRHFNHSQLLNYDIKQNKWDVIEPKGPAIPEARSRHAACLSEDKTKMFVSGGLFKDDFNDPYDDLRIFNLKTGLWESSRRFICRFDHFITNYDGKIWSLGGLTKDMAHVTEISWFDLQTNITGSISINQLPKFQGDHIFMKPTSNGANTSLILDVVVPLFSMNSTVEPWIGLYDLNSLRWHAVLTGAFKPLLSYKWKHTFIHESKLYLIGYPSVNGEDDTPFDFNLKSLIRLDLEDLGVVEKFNRKRKHNEDSMALEFGEMLRSGSFTDFEIGGIEGNERPSLDAVFVENNEPKDVSHLEPGFQTGESSNDIFIKSKPIKVHTTILLARWPHFKRIITSGMQEAKTSTLFIPEPISWIKALMEFLYTNDISQPSLEIYSGLLILSNLYEIPKLRKFCIHHINIRGFTLQGAISVWTRARLINEEVLTHNAANFISKNWQAVIRSKAFEELPKEDIVSLCRMVSIVGTGRDRYDDDDGFQLNNYDRDYVTDPENEPTFGTYSEEPNFGLSNGLGSEAQDDPTDEY